MSYPDNDAAARKRVIRSSLWLTAPGTYAALGLAYAVVPPLAGLTQPSERLVLAAQWLLVAFIPYAAVCLTILYQRYAEGAHNPFLGAESERLQVHCRVMQNTLEQLFWFGLCLLSLATFLSAALTTFAMQPPSDGFQHLAISGAILAFLAALPAGYIASSFVSPFVAIAVLFLFAERHSHRRRQTNS